MAINKSLIIPLKNETKEVITIIKRFFKQFLHEDTELIIVLDDEKDPTFKILKNLTLDIKILISELEPGASNAVKYGISKCNGKFICIAMGDGSDDQLKLKSSFFLLREA